MKSLPNNQRGFTMLSMSLTVMVLGYIAYQAVPLVGRMQSYTFRTATVSGINELAQAAKTFYVDPANSTSWPASPEVLSAGSYLPNFQNRNGYGYPFSFSVVGDSLVVTTEAASAEQASAVASHFGGLASLSGNEISVTWSAPGTDANHQALVPRDGSRDIFGTITHRAGGSAGLILNGNNINSVGDFDSTGTVTIRNSGSTGLVNSDVGAIDTLTVNEFRITP
jgi:Tfp pilus assembly protein PilE